MKDRLTLHTKGGKEILNEEEKVRSHMNYWERRLSWLLILRFVISTIYIAFEMVDEKDIQRVNSEMIHFFRC